MATLSRTVLIDEELERNASRVLAEMGLTVSEFLEQMLKQVVHDECLPFAMHIPNAETIAAMKESESGEGKRYTSLDELFRDMRE